MFDIVLFEPEIPPNTGNIIRLAANAGFRLHLIEPLGFRINDRSVRRAGLDYGEMSSVHRHRDWNAFTTLFQDQRLFALTTHGTRSYAEVAYAPGDVLIFGPETRGLPASVLEDIPAEARLRLPMQPGSRSLNLSNAVAVVAYEAWRQQGFPGGI